MKWNVETYNICQRLLLEIKEWHAEGVAGVRDYHKSNQLPQLLNIDRTLFNPAPSSAAILAGHFSLQEDGSFLIQSEENGETWIVQQKPDIIPTVLQCYQYYRVGARKSSQSEILYHVNDFQNKIYFWKLFAASSSFQCKFIRAFATAYCFQYLVIEEIMNHCPVLDVANLIMSFSFEIDI